MRLRPVRADDWLFFHQADQDTDAAANGYFIPFPRNEEGARKWAEEEAGRLHNGDEIRLVIETVEGKPVGTLNLHGCNPRNGTFEYGIAITRENWGHGFAGEAILLILGFMFRERRYQKANATVYAFNERSQRLHEKLGFTLEGRIRSNIFSGGKHHDELWYGMTAAEFFEHREG